MDHYRVWIHPALGDDGTPDPFAATADVEWVGPTAGGTIPEHVAHGVPVDLVGLTITAHLDRIDQAVSKCGTCDGTGLVAGSGPFHYAVHPCPDCEGAVQ